MIGQNRSTTRAYGAPETLLNDLRKIVTEVYAITARQYGPEKADEMIVDAVQDGIDNFRTGMEPKTREYRIHREDRSGLTQRRERLGISPAEMADRLGIATTALMKMESGQTPYVKMTVRKKVEKEYGCKWSQVVITNDVRTVELKDYMDDQGVTVDDIADLLGEEPERVAEWIEDPGQIPVEFALEITDAMGLNPHVVFQPKLAAYMAKEKAL